MHYGREIVERNHCVQLHHNKYNVRVPLPNSSCYRLLLTAGNTEPFKGGGGGPYPNSYQGQDPSIMVKIKVY